MVPTILFNAALLSTCLYVWTHGERDERLTATALFIATYASVPGQAFWSHVEFLIWGVDAALLGFLLWIMARSTKFWPIWVAGFQIPAAATHIAIVVAPELAGFGYATYVIIWAYAVMAALLTGTYFEVIVSRKGMRTS